MASTTAMCTSFKVEILTAMHNFGTTVTRGATTADVFKMALYTSTATNGAGTTAYSTTNEITNTSGTAYTAGGATISISQVPTSTSTTAWLNFSNVTWSTASFTAASALVYNSTTSPGTKTVCSLDFGGDKTVSSGTFTVQMPASDSSNAIIRIA